MYDRHFQELQGRARHIALLETVVYLDIKYIYVNVCSAVVDCVDSSMFLRVPGIYECYPLARPVMRPFRPDSISTSW